MRLKKELKCGNNGGFSIVEALIAMMVLGVTLTAVYGGLSFGLTSIRHAREQQRAMQIMLDAVEMIRLYSWEQLNTPGFVPRNFIVKDDGTVAQSLVPGIDRQVVLGTGVNYHGRITLSDPSLSTNYDFRLKEVQVDLVWRSGGMERKRQLKTLVTFGGLYAYLF